MTQIDTAQQIPGTHRDTEFDRDTELTAAGDGVYTRDLVAGWQVGNALNGGYLLAVVGQAVRQELTPRGKPDPVSVTAHFASAGTPEPAQVRVQVRREGGSLATVAAELWQDDRLRVAVLATYGDLEKFAAGSTEERVTLPAPTLPPREQCVPSTMASPEFRRNAPLTERASTLFHPEQIGWAVGEPSGGGEISAWYRLADGRDPDPISLLQVVDTLPPVTFDLGLPGWAPTLELTCHIRRRPAPGWLQVRHATRVLTAGMFEEDCDVWDSAGQLVAQARQLARLPR